MSHPVPRQQSSPDAARSDCAPAPQADRSLPDFQPPAPSPYSSIEREIERSQRASAALAATRALARASFTDSQLAAEDADAQEADGWIRTEYAALDASAHVPQDDAAPRHLVGGSFDPGIASPQGRAFPSAASIAQAPIRTRSGAQARFLHEARHAPRPARGVGAAVRSELSLGAPHPGKPAVPTPPATAPAAAQPRAPAAAQPRARGAAPPRERARGSARFLFAAGLGAAAVLIGGGLAWKSGLMSRNNPGNAALITPAVAAQAEAARVLSASPQEIPITPAAGVPAQRSSAEIDAALAAAERAAAVPAASVRAAGPARVAPEAPAITPPVTAQAAPAMSAQRAPVRQADVAEAIANAQARADRFLSSGNGGAAAPAASTEARQPQ